MPCHICFLNDTIQTIKVTKGRFQKNMFVVERVFCAEQSTFLNEIWLYRDKQVSIHRLYDQMRLNTFMEISIL